ncbi:MAG: DUF6702 family protein [Bacteroidota bacterium]
MFYWLYLFSLLFSYQSAFHAQWKLHHTKHNIYISTIQIEHWPGDTLASLQVKVFSDDLLDALRPSQGQSNWPKDSLCTSANLELKSYFEKNLQCQVNRQTSPLRLTQCQQTQDVHLLSFTLRCPIEWQTVTLTARFFMELFPQQSNVIQLRENDRTYFGRATSNKTTLHFPITP